MKPLTKLRKEADLSKCVLSIIHRGRVCTSPSSRIPACCARPEVRKKWTMTSWLGFSNARESSTRVRALRRGLALESRETGQTEWRVLRRFSRRSHSARRASPSSHFAASVELTKRLLICRIAWAHVFGEQLLSTSFSLLSPTKSSETRATFRSRSCCQWVRRTSSPEICNRTAMSVDHHQPNSDSLTIP